MVGRGIFWLSTWSLVNDTVELWFMNIRRLSFHINNDNRQSYEVREELKPEWSINDAKRLSIIQRLYGRTKLVGSG